MASASASSLYDDYKIASSEAGTMDTAFLVESRTVLDINDNNNGNYQGGQITLDLNQLVSSSDFLDWSSSYLTIPLVFTATSVQGGAILPDFANKFAMSLKGSNLAIINSVNLTCSNHQIIGNQQLSNIPIEWNLLTSFNENDVDAIGASFNFQKDTSRTVLYDHGIGEYNNCVGFNNAFVSGNTAESALAANQLSFPNPQNVGMYKRCYKQSYAIGDGTTNNSDPTLLNFVSPAQLQKDRVSTCTTSPFVGALTAVKGVTLTTPAIQFNLWLQIPMKYVHDFFAKMPLNRGALWQLVITTHLPCSCQCTLSATDSDNGTVTQWASGSSITPYQFLPFMVGMPYCLTTANSYPAGYGALSAPVMTADTATTVNFSAFIDSSLGTTLHCVTYKLNPTLTDSYLANSRKHTVYWDYIRAQPSGAINVGNQFVNVNIAPGQAKVRGLLIVPYIGGTPVGTNNGLYSNGMSALTSPFSSCGATTAISYFDNFNVLIGGRAIFQKAYQYRFDMFEREVAGINCPNGNAINALRAGLIDEADFNQSYGYMYVNLERHLKDSDKLQVSVDVQFQNNLTGAGNGGAQITQMSYNFYLFYEAGFSLDCANGKIFV